MKLRAALLVDNLQVAKWQLEALEAANDSIDIVLLLNCENTRTKKNYVKKFFYYALNVFTLKNSLTKRAPINREIAKVINFESLYEGAWQSFPKKIYESLEKENIDLVIKFGMSLLRLEENQKIPPILSFHHGNPSKYRGRPAGFYEILNDEKKVGTIVQNITNKLDAGKIYAFSESRITNYSYKKTAINLYSNSRFLLSKAIDNFLKQKQEKISKNGINYKLPGNYKVLRFLFSQSPVPGRGLRAPSLFGRFPWSDFLFPCPPAASALPWRRLVYSSPENLFHELSTPFCVRNTSQHAFSKIASGLKAICSRARR